MHYRYGTGTQFPYLLTQSESPYIYQNQPQNVRIPTKPNLAVRLLTKPNLAVRLHTKPNLAVRLPTKPNLAVRLPTKPNLTVRLPTKPNLSVRLPTKPNLRVCLPVVVSPHLLWMVQHVVILGSALLVPQGLVGC